MRLMVLCFLVTLVCGVISLPNPNSNPQSEGACSNEYKRKMLRQHCGDFRRRRRETYQFAKHHYGPIYDKGGGEITIHDKGGAEIRISKRGKAHYCCGKKCVRINTCI